MHSHNTDILQLLAAVLEQLKKAQEEEARKKDKKQKSHNKKSLPSSAENREHKQPEGEAKGEQGQQQADSMKRSTNNNGDNIMEHADNHNSINQGDNATEELRRKVAAAVAAEEEAKYRLDQKIMGLAGITSLYKNSNIGFAKYFQHKDELREKEEKKRETPNKKEKQSSNVTGWLAPFHHLRSSSSGNNAVAINSDGRKISVTKFTSSTNTLQTDLSSVGTKDTLASMPSSSKRKIFMSKKRMKKALNSDRMKAYQRQEFDTFVRGLISNIEEISAVVSSIFTN